MNGETILLAFEGPLAILTLNRSEKLNALTPDMLDGIARALDSVEERLECRALVVAAAGERAFCVGADVKLWSSLEPVEMWRSWTRRGQRVFDRLAGLRQPSIAAINGLALGGGLELAMACDLRVASTGAGFGMPEVTIATLPGWGGSHRLAALVGIGRARQMVLTGERIDAETASAWGLVNEIAADARGRARELALRISQNAPVSVQIAKEILAALPDGGRASERLERLAGAVAAATADGREGIAALAERRPPQFDGGVK